MTALTPQSYARGQKPLEGIELSKKVAELYGIYALKGTTRDAPYIWLHEDSARCFELMVEHNLFIKCRKENAYVIGTYPITVKSPDSQGYRTAILQCLVAMKEQESDGTHPNQTGPWS